MKIDKVSAWVATADASIIPTNGDGRCAWGVLPQRHHEADQPFIERNVVSQTLKHRRFVDRFLNGHFHASPLPLKLPHYCRIANNIAKLVLTCHDLGHLFGETGQCRTCVEQTFGIMDICKQCQAVACVLPHRIRCILFCSSICRRPTFLYIIFDNMQELETVGAATESRSTRSISAHPAHSSMTPSIDELSLAVARLENRCGALGGSLRAESDAADTEVARAKAAEGRFERLLVWARKEEGRRREAEERLRRACGAGEALEARVKVVEEEVRTLLDSSIIQGTPRSVAST